MSKMFFNLPRNFEVLKTCSFYELLPIGVGFCKKKSKIYLTFVKILTYLEALCIIYNASNTSNSIEL